MTKPPLDLLFETQLQPDVIDLAALLVKPGGQPTATMTALCKELKVNAEPAVGMLELFHLTPPHQHAMGGLNMAGRQVVKTWWFCPPSSYGPSLGSGRSVRPSESDRASAIRLEQFEGDVIWIPPGWWHSVFTRCGDTISHNMQDWPDDEYAAHWVTWVLPAHMSYEALAQWGCSWAAKISAHCVPVSLCPCPCTPSAALSLQQPCPSLMDCPPSVQDQWCCDGLQQQAGRGGGGTLHRQPF
jgi:hypothetical protein